MADSQDTKTEARVRSNDIFEQLYAAGVDGALVVKTFEYLETERAETIAKAARLFYNVPANKDQISPLQFATQLGIMKRRIWVLDLCLPIS